MSRKDPIESVLQGVRLKPPGPHLRQTVLQAADRAWASRPRIHDRLPWRWWVGMAACLALVALTQAICEWQLTRWTRPRDSASATRRDVSILEDLGWGTLPAGQVRFSRISVPVRMRGLHDYRHRLQQLLEDPGRPPLEEARRHRPDGQSRLNPWEISFSEAHTS